MRIAIDARAWKWTGVGRYIRALVQEYARMEQPHTFVLLMPDDSDAMAEARELTKPQVEKFELRVVGSSYYSWREQLALPLHLANVQADLFHFPHFNVPLFFNRPYVVTIHDTTRFYFPGQKRQGLLQQLAYELVFTHAIRSAKHVMCVSEHTAEELTRLRVRSGRQKGKERISIIHEGVDEKFSQPVSESDRVNVRRLLGTDDPYLVMVGVWMSHKNIPRTLKAFGEARKKHPKLKLVITGEYKRGYVDVAQLAKEVGVANAVILPGFVPDELLPALYAQAQALVFASLYEGFGLPALEAAAVGTPVIASNVSSLPEVMGTAAEYVNPDDTADIARGIETVLADQELREQLAAAGKQRTRTFSWNTCAKQTLDVYESVQ